MTPEPMRSPDASPAEVMASVDTSARRPKLIIADVSREDAWISVPEAESASLEEWC